MDEITFGKLFGHSAVTRAGFEKIRKNLDFISPQNK
jgi:hypothetical protein